MLVTHSITPHLEKEPQDRAGNGTLSVEQVTPGLHLHNDGVLGKKSAEKAEADDNIPIQIGIVCMKDYYSAQRHFCLGYDS